MLTRDVMILAAGLGSRLKQYTKDTPKPILPIPGGTSIELLLDKLDDEAIGNIAINCSYHAEQIIDHLHHNPLRDKITFSPETIPLESAGGIKLALHRKLLHDKQPLLVCNSDIVLDFLPSSLATTTEHIWAQLLVGDNPNHHKNGDFWLMENGLINFANQAPSANSRRCTFIGIGCYDPIIFEHIPVNEPAALAPILRKLADQKKCQGHYFTGKWLDIGHIQTYEQLKKQL